MTMKNRLKEIIKKIHVVTDGNNQIRDIFQEIILMCTTIQLGTVAQVVKESSLDEISTKKRIEIAGKLTASINDLMMPLVNAIEKRTDGRHSFDGTKLARDMNAISDEMELIVETKNKDKNTQSVSVSVGKKIELPKDIDEELIKMAMASNQLGKA